MPNFNLSIKWSKNSGLALSSAELIERYFFGISLCTKNGVSITNDTLNSKISAAQQFLENYLGLKLTPTVIEENPDFIRSDYAKWGYLKCTYPVREVHLLHGAINSVATILYPTEWASWSKPSEDNQLGRNVHLVPIGQTSINFGSTIVFSGISHLFNYVGSDNIPNYWKLIYCTGFEKVPADILEALGKIAAIQIFAILGDIQLGAGIAAQSLSFDGISQSIQTTQSAENSAFSARIRQYQGELKNDLKDMKDFYRGMRFIAL